MTFTLFSPYARACCIGGLLACGLSGCYSTTTLDRHFGMAVKNAQSSQTIPSAHAPQHERDMDAGIVHSGIVRYEKSYVTPPLPVSSLDQGLGQPSSMAPR